MDTTPSDITKQILSYLPIREVTILKQLNSHFRKVIERYYRNATLWDSSKVPTHILSYLSSKDVANFRLLNPDMRRITMKNRTCLQYPGVNLYVEQHIHGIVRIRLTFQAFYWAACFIKVVNTEAVEVKISRSGHPEARAHFRYDETPDNKHFFRPLFEGKHSIAKIFDFILEKADIHYLELRGSLDPNCFAILLNSIRNSYSRIVTVSIDPTHKAFRQRCQLVKVVGKQKSPGKDFPNLEMKLKEVDLLRNNWRPLQIICDFASSFKSVMLHVRDTEVEDIMTVIVEKWSENMLTEFKFDLFVYESSSYGLNPVVVYQAGDTLSLIIDEQKGCVRMKNSRSGTEKEYPRIAESL